MLQKELNSLVVKFLWIKFILVSAIILLKLPGSGSIIPLHSFHWWTLFFFLPLWQEVHQICPSFKLPILIFLYTLLCFCFVFIYFAVILIIYFQPLALGLSDFFYFSWYCSQVLELKAFFQLCAFCSGNFPFVTALLFLWHWCCFGLVPCLLWNLL